MCVCVCVCVCVRVLCCVNLISPLPGMLSTLQLKHIFWNLLPSFAVFVLLVCLFVCLFIFLVQNCGTPPKRVLIREVSLFQRLICTQKYTIGTSETVLIRELSLFQRLICTQKYTIGTSETVLIREVSLFQRCPVIFYLALHVLN